MLPRGKSFHFPPIYASNVLGVRNNNRKKSFCPLPSGAALSSNNKKAKNSATKSDEV
jgi:hypothetical protein